MSLRAVALLSGESTSMAMSLASKGVPTSGAASIKTCREMSQGCSPKGGSTAPIARKRLTTRRRHQKTMLKP
ncbi:MULTISPECIES: hypothetical protein [Sphingopyxis]|uniref:hypothetical protein n=1 Tax=Sphingopyxis TaxID=165697 RepID=UPI0012E36F3A|nr:MULTISPECIES: hypothetical protein [Sphingopyxis]